DRGLSKRPLRTSRQVGRREADSKDADQTETRERRMFARPHATAGRPVRDLALATALLAAAAFWAPAGRAADTPAVDQALHDSLPDQYKKNGVKVAAFNDWPPDEFVENGELKGWSIDMAKAMSAKLGVDFHVTGTSFDVIIPGLSSGRFDAGFSSFGV